MNSIERRRLHKSWPQRLRFTALALIILLALTGLLGACGGSDQTPEATATPSEASDTTFLPQISSGDQDAKSSSPAADTFSWESLEKSLANLNSYRVEARMFFSGQTEQGEPLDWSVTWQAAAAEQPPAYRVDISTEGFGAEGQFSSMSAAQIDGENYLALTGAGCVSGDDIDVRQLSDSAVHPDSYLAGLNGAELAAEGLMVDGQKSAAYSFDENSLPAWQDVPVSIDGTVYTAEDNGSVSRIEMTASGLADFAGVGSSQDGVFTMQLDVSQINEAITIQVPATCEWGAGFPVPEDAFNVANFKDTLFFASHMTPSEIADFYLTEMPQDGWQQISTDELFEDSAALTFEKEGTRLNVFITLDEDGQTTEVVIAP